MIGPPSAFLPHSAVFLWVSHRPPPSSPPSCQSSPTLKKSPVSLLHRKRDKTVELMGWFMLNTNEKAIKNYSFAHHHINHSYLPVKQLLFSVLSWVSWRKPSPINDLNQKYIYKEHWLTVAHQETEKYKAVCHQHSHELESSWHVMYLDDVCWWQHIEIKVYCLKLTPVELNLSV